MKRCGVIMGICAVVVGTLWSTGARAAENTAPAVSATLDVPVLSAYVWRGQVLNDELVIQPSLTVTRGGFSLNAWSSLNCTDTVTLTPSIQYTFIMDCKVEDGAADLYRDDRQFFGGAKLTWAM